MTTNKTVLISGGNRGIGAATARAFMEAGWSVSLGMRTPAMPDWARPEAVHVHAYDAVDPVAPDAWAAAAVERFGRIDAVVANAGISIRKTAVEATDAEFASLMDVNVNGPRRLVRACWAQLVACGSGRVVIVASLSGKRVKSAASGSYSVSKFAALGLSHAIRHAGFDKGVRATAVCPGFVATDMGLPLAASTPADALTQPEDVASSIVHIVNLPNRASVSEFWVNCLLDDSY
ncbi:SDR family NAD(P)-dependent oxidoreductase [Rhizobiaceae bacterium BDR2-2]|uniref:SDR family NAD(P)-dependent oxidoreductase n=1 Tax=Ectorhizobium quercum TaxID=2965071 RepID=A0AAE3SWB2_9HYPH|nr:SDR family NAD(P)-dependent oxidoreductase [Ectorhizobium quercum]MCX8997270.1 SDR family NAD(P)-dependent oxidoreductase [Ectorhizobium quercum]